MDIVTVHNLKKYFGKGENQVSALWTASISRWRRENLPRSSGHPDPGRPLC